MHKSLKNFITIREILRRLDPEVLRLYYASTHYRKPIEFDETHLEEPKRELEYLCNTLRNIRDSASKDGKEPADLKKTLNQTKRDFTEAMSNDFNTPQALTHLYALARRVNIAVSKQSISLKLAEETTETLKQLGKILGILEKELPERGEIPEQVEELVEQREDARSNKDWKRADAIREQIKKLGYVLEDTPEGPRLRKIQ